MVGHYNDLAFGLYKAAKYYSYPGWHEPGTPLEAITNKEAFAVRPEDLQSIVPNACKAFNNNMQAEYTPRNHTALDTLINIHQVIVRLYPDDVLSKLRKLSDNVVKEVVAKDKLTEKVYESFRKFRDQGAQWHNVSERAYLHARGL